MEISQVFKCPCNGRIYPSLQSLKQHKKTKIHLSWEGSRELRELKKELTIRDNKILKLENRIDTLLELNQVLLCRIKTTSRTEPSH